MPKKRKQSEKSNSEVMKRLLAAQLIKAGVQANVVADIMGIDKSQLSRMIPVSKIQKK